MLKKRYRPPHDKTSGLSFDIALFPHEHKTYTGVPDEQTKRTKRERKVHTVRPAGLKTRRSFSYTIITKHSCF
jgi:hypothetical protein